jgi:DNA-directed RNA polymerase specialized sigma24 family protein
MLTDEQAARKWLGRARMIDREIAALTDAKRETREQLTRITQNYSADGAQTSKDPHKYDKLAELESLIDSKVSELCEIKAEITAAIIQIPDGRRRCVLLSYYVRCMTLEQIAVEMSYNYRHIKRLLREGITEIALSSQAHAQNMKDSPPCPRQM